MSFPNSLPNLHYDPRLESYRSFFDHTWAEEIYTLCAKSQLELPTFSFCMNCKAIANTLAWPWIMMLSMKHVFEGSMAAREPMGNQLVSAVSKNLIGAMGDSLSNMRRKQLRLAIQELADKLEEANDSAEEIFDAEDSWMKLLSPQHGELELGLWSTSRTSYSNLFHAYEDFIRSCVALSKNEPGYQAHRFKDLAKDTSDAFGQQTAQYCLHSDPIRLARLVRNALAHNGGKMTDQLRAMQPDLPVDQDDILIFAPDVGLLFEELKIRATKLVKTALPLPGMR